LNATNNLVWHGTGEHVSKNEDNVSHCVNMDMHYPTHRNGWMDGWMFDTAV
jgi:hypothetical protein